MKRSIVLLLMFLLLRIPPAICQPQETQSSPVNLVLNNEIITIENANLNITGGLSLSGNSSLTLINTTLTFLESDDANYTISGNSRLIIINSTINVGNQRGIQAQQYAYIELSNVNMYQTRQIYNRTLYPAGIGLSGNSEIIITDSKIGFIRAMDNTQCTVIGSHIGDFGTQSRNVVQLKDCIVERVLFVYENSRVQINQSITGNHEWFTQSQLVKTGQIP
ncbi:hypothetical protein MUP51_04810, partial [Candidatus Bathyarchaeota archaeon]|nr:hypothetical protein [Candidatus Bathyarchaeota archaeon]